MPYLQPEHELRQVDLFGLKLTTCSLDRAVSEVLLRTKYERTTVAFVNLHTANLIRSKPGYGKALASADLLFNDGIGAEIAFRLLGSRVIEDLAGNVVVPGVLRDWLGDKCRVFLLGSTLDVLERAAERVVVDHPNVEIVGTHAGYFERSDEPAICDQINASKCDVLLVGMGNPHQEEFLGRNRDRLNAQLTMAVGGLVDIWGGKLREYPAWATRLRCHWLVRLVQEPRRLWRRYLIGAPLFFWRVLLWRWTNKQSAASSESVRRQSSESETA